MASVRHGEHFLTTEHLVTWLKTYQSEWLAELQADRRARVQVTGSMVPSFANRYGYHHRVPCPAKSTQGELAVTQEAFAADFGLTFGHLPKHAWINVDETPVTYDMPPARVGQSSRVKESQKHYDRITTVLSIRADGMSLLIASTHCKSGVFFQPLPANTTSVLQPLDVGVMGPFKQMCRTEWIKEDKVITAAEERLVMIKRAIKVWDGMKEDTVRKSFEKALHIYEI
ncbi:hypothetical protein B5M09_013964 [Aphanomyces astaci]|uniref:DDE-1 domain-containing protein n=1 Tax=Aphanomyces astaci TaxID=112090 RepID=A0A3R7W9J1_APHAT|nr:hypothetical protein B5M09_013964 [Aphanomyces astaci]